MIENTVVYAGENTLECVKQVKYLGVILVPHLTFHAHCDYIKLKTLGKIGALGRIRSIVDHKTSLMLYKTLVLPLFDYCDLVYNCLSRKDCFNVF